MTRRDYLTLGDIAEELRRMRDAGMTRESIEYALEKILPEGGAERIPLEILFDALKGLQVVSLDRLGLVVQAVVEAGWTPPKEAEDGQ